MMSFSFVDKDTGGYVKRGSDITNVLNRALHVHVNYLHSNDDIVSEHNQTI